MTCYHPLVAEKINKKSQWYQKVLAGKVKKVHILGKADDLMNYDVYSGEASERFLVPCGKCIGCRIDKARDWAVRICCEAQTSPNASWFITLTYDDDHLSDLSLNKKDFQNFIKDVRNYLYYRYGSTIRYFGCGEYGDSSGRSISIFI